MPVPPSPVRRGVRAAPPRSEVVMHDARSVAPTPGALALPTVLRPAPPPALPQGGSPIATLLPREIARQLLWLPYSALPMGQNIVAGRGSGKSRLMGRVIAWQALLRGEGLVIIDPVGGTISNLLDKILRLPDALQEHVWPRVLYMDLAGGDRVVPLPFYYRLGGESYHEIAARFTGLVEKVDTRLGQAPVLGLSALKEIASRAGMVLAALGLQMTEVSDLLAYPERWEARLRRASEVDPLVARAARFFLDQYARWSPAQRDRMTATFLAKLEPLDLDPVARAMFGAATPGISWADVVSKGQIVLIDASRERDPMLARFKLMAVFCHVVDFIKHRGRTRTGPLNLIIDELAYLAQVRGDGEISAFDREFNDLCNTWMRQGKVHLTCAYQEPYQVSEYTKQTTMSLGTQILGVTTDHRAAIDLAERHFPIDQTRVKAWRANVHFGLPEPIYMTVEEQLHVSAHIFKSLRLFEFLVRPARGEGDLGERLYPITIKNIDRGQWPDDERVAEARARLRQHTGVPVAEILAEVEARRQKVPTKRSTRPVKIEDDDDIIADPLPR